MKEESFLKSFFAVGKGAVINIIIGLVTTPIITRIVDPYENGQFSIFTTYTNLALVVLCFGMDQALVRFYYRSENLNDKRRIIKESSIIPVVVSVVVLVFYVLLVYFGAMELKMGKACAYLLGVNVIINVLYRFASLIVRLNHNNTLYARLMIIHKVIYVILALLFLKVLRQNSAAMLAISAIVSVTVSLIVSVVSQKKYLSLANCGYDHNELKTMLRFGIPFIFSMGITALFHSLDKLALERYRTYSEVGVYSSAMAFIAAFNVVQTAFNTVWAPKAMEHYSNNPEDKKLYKRVYSIIALIMFTLGICLILFKDLLVYMLGEKYREAAYIMPFLVFEPIMYTVSETTVGGINFAKKSSFHIIVAMVACLVNYVGNTLLVPELGCKGAAISTGVSYICFFALRTFFGEKCFRIGFDIKKIIAATLSALVYALYSTFYKFDLLNVIIALLCLSVVFICFRDTIKYIWQYAKTNILSLTKTK